MTELAQRDTENTGSIKSELDRMEALNAELLEALERIVYVWPNEGKVPGWTHRWVAAMDNAKALVKRARG